MLYNLAPDYVRAEADVSKIKPTLVPLPNKASRTDDDKYWKLGHFSLSEDPSFIVEKSWYRLDNYWARPISGYLFQFADMYYSFYCF
jgi:hypothetical protein